MRGRRSGHAAKGLGVPREHGLVDRGDRGWCGFGIHLVPADGTAERERTGEEFGRRRQYRCEVPRDASQTPAPVDLELGFDTRLHLDIALLSRLKVNLVFMSCYACDLLLFCFSQIDALLLRNEVLYLVLRRLGGSVGVRGDPRCGLSFGGGCSKRRAFQNCKPMKNNSWV